MTLSELCDIIDLQPEIKSRVFAFAENFDFDTVEECLRKFYIYQNIKSACIELQNILGEDDDKIKILACMLKASSDAYDFYKSKGISDEIYVSTMKCYTRFINETYEITGRLYFNRYWWTARQAGCHLFRIGELEYEIKPMGNSAVIGMHIPSDADFCPASVDESLRSSKIFFAVNYPELSNCEYRCHSWLLDSHLKDMLDENSNILNFQRRFEIFDEGEADNEFVEWVFKSRTTDYTTLPENTSLQKNMKKSLLAGVVIRNSYGRLKSIHDYEK